MLRAADWIVVVAAAFAVGAVAVLAWTAAAGAVAEIRGPQGTVRVDLHRDARVTVPGLGGDSVLEVAGGRVRFVSSACRNRVCIAAGALSRAGAFAACVPNGVSVLVQGDGHGYDAVAH